MQFTQMIPSSPLMFSARDFLRMLHKRPLCNGLHAGQAVANGLRVCNSDAPADSFICHRKSAEYFSCLEPACFERNRLKTATAIAGMPQDGARFVVREN